MRFYMSASVFFCVGNRIAIPINGYLFPQSRTEREAPARTSDTALRPIAPYVDVCRAGFDKVLLMVSEIVKVGGHTHLQARPFPPVEPGAPGAVGNNRILLGCRRPIEFDDL